MQMLAISVVIPLYNKRNTILSTLQSVRNQHSQAQEIIVVDDGSSDGGAELVAELATESNWPELRLIRQANSGVSAARNRGIKAARSPYIAFLDADDRWLPFFLHEMRQLIRRFPQQQLFACRYQKLAAAEQYIDADIYLTEHSADGYIMPNYFELASKGDLPFMISGCVVKKAFLEQLDGFPEDEWMGEDQSLFMQAAKQNGIAYSPQIHLLYNVASDNRASEKTPPAQPCAYALRAMYWLQQGELPQQMQPHAARYVAAHLCDLAKRNVKAGRFATALTLLRLPETQAKPLHRLIWRLAAYSGAIAAWPKHRLQPNTQL